MSLNMMPMSPNVALFPQGERAYLWFSRRAPEAELVQGCSELVLSAQREPNLGSLVREPPELLAPGNLTMPIRNRNIETPN